MDMQSTQGNSGSGSAVKVSAQGNSVADPFSALTQLGRDTSRHLVEKAQRASQTTVTYIKDEPVKAMFISAAVGAALMGLIRLRNRSH